MSEEETKPKLREEIKHRSKLIDLLYHEINKIAESAIPDFHFLDHKVSTFWDCDDSPIGMCVFELDHLGRTTECLYCGGPEERK